MGSGRGEAVATESLLARQMINLTWPLPSRATTRGEKREGEREREGSSAAQLSLLAWTIVSPETKLKNAPLAPRQPHRSSCSVSSTEWNSLPTKEDKSYFFIRSSSVREARTKADEIRSPFFFSFSFSFNSCPSARMSKPRTIRVSSTLFCRRVRLHSSSSATPLDTFLAIHKRRAPHAPTILSRFRV